MLVSVHGLAQMTNRFGCPAAMHIVDAPEARLVLKPQSDGFSLPVFAEVLERFEEFFSTRPEPPGHFVGGVCLGPVCANHGGAAGCKQKTAT